MTFIDSLTDSARQLDVIRENTDEEKELAKRYLEKCDAWDLIAMLDL